MSSYEVDGKTIYESFITINCCKCDREFTEHASTYITTKEFQTTNWKNKKITDYECVCCRDDYHQVTWDYETAEDNMCGDGCMIEGTCLNCGATGRGEFSNRDVDFEVGDL